MTNTWVDSWGDMSRIKNTNSAKKISQLTEKENIFY